MRPGCGVYLHFPFCLSKCAYCDFISRPLRSSEELDRYVKALRAEIRLRARGRAETVYLGGGTPSLCTPGQIRDVLGEIGRKMSVSPNAEITLEANPATVDFQRLMELRAAGINRLSLGVQTTSDARLRFLGRAHSAAQSEALFQDARRAGFKNISCDLIYGLPGQSVEEFSADLDALLAWSPDHVSLYALSVEPGTPLADRIANRECPEPDPDPAADQYSLARETLEKKGYLQYELSNFARPGRVCRHNLAYWTLRPYWGFGVAAHAYRRGVRSWNLSDLEAYQRALARKISPRAGSEKLKYYKRIAEQFIVGLRLTGGIRKRRLERRYGSEWARPFTAAFSALTRKGLLLDEAESLKLTPQGMLLANVVFRELL